MGGYVKDVLAMFVLCVLALPVRAEEFVLTCDPLPDRTVLVERWLTQESPIRESKTFEVEVTTSDIRVSGDSVSLKTYRNRLNFHAFNGVRNFRIHTPWESNGGLFVYTITGSAGAWVEVGYCGIK